MADSDSQTAAIEQTFKMRYLNVLLGLVSTIGLTSANPIDPRQNTPPRAFAGYLISTFSDPNPQVQFHLSNGNSPSDFTFANNGRAVLNSTVGTKGVRDQFLATNDARDVWYLIATGMLLYYSNLIIMTNDCLSLIHI